MFSTRKLYELGRDVDLIRRIMNDLAAAAPRVVFVPAISIQLMLFARVSEIYQL